MLPVETRCKRDAALLEDKSHKLGPLHEKGNGFFDLLCAEDGLYKCLILKRDLVGASGFEPPTSWSRTRRSSQAEPRPVF